MGVSRPIRPAEAGLDIGVVSATFLGAVFALAAITGTLATAPFATAIALAVCSTILKRRGERWRDLGLGPPRPWPLALVSSFLLAFLVLFTMARLQPALEGRFGAVDLSEFRALEGDTALYVYFLFVAWFLAGFGEETLFRGFLMRRLAQAGGGGRVAWALALVGQAVVFGALHFYQGPAGMILTGLIGLLFGLAFLGLERNLWACIVAHALVDTLGFTDLYLGRGLL